MVTGCEVNPRVLADGGTKMVTPILVSGIKAIGMVLAKCGTRMARIMLDTGLRETEADLAC